MISSLTLSEAISMFLRARIGIVSLKTLRTNRSYLRSLAEFLDSSRPLGSFTLNHLRAWRASLFEKEISRGRKRTRPRASGKLSVHTIHGMVRVTRQFFKWTFDEGILKINLAARLELPPLPKGPPKNIAESDVLKMFEAARFSSRDTAILWFLHDTGCRLAGAANVKLHDLDLEDGTAIVWEKGRGGLGVARAVYLKPRAVAALRAYLEERPDTCDLDGNPVTDAVFVSERFPHNAIKEGGVYVLLKRLARAAGVYDPSSPQAWRHAFARRFLRNGGSLGAVSRLLGHSRIGVTDDFYAVFTRSELKEQHARFA